MLFSSPGVHQLQENRCSRRRRFSKSEKGQFTQSHIIKKNNLEMNKAKIQHIEHHALNLLKNAIILLISECKINSAKS